MQFPHGTLPHLIHMTFFMYCLPYNEEIMLVMATCDKPWEDMHHRAYFLLDPEKMEKSVQNLVSSVDVLSSSLSNLSHNILSGGC